MNYYAGPYLPSYIH